MGKFLLQRRQPFPIFLSPDRESQKENPIDGLFLRQAFLHHGFDQQIRDAACSLTGA